MCLLLIFTRRKLLELYHLTHLKMSFSIHLLQAVAFLDLFAIGLVVPLLPRHVQAMGGNHIYVGLLGSIYAGFQLGSGPLIGSLSDLKGRKSILLITLVMSSIAYVLVGVTDSITLILLFRAYLGVFKQTQILTRAMVPDYEANSQKQGEVYGKMMATSGVGITLGPIVGGHFVEAYPTTGFAYLSVAVSMIFIINAGLVNFILPKAKAKDKKKQSNEPSSNLLHSISSSLKQSMDELYSIRWSRFWDIFLLKGLIGFAMGIYYSNYSIFLSTEFGLSPKYIGYTISFQGIIGSVSSYFIGFLNSFYNQDQDYTQRNLHVFIMMTAALLGIILSTNMFFYLLCLIPLAIGNAMGRLITLEMVLNQGHGDHRGTLIGASNSVRSMSGVIAPMVGGVIGQFKGVSYVIYASLLATFLGVILSYKIKHKKLKSD